MTQQFTPSPTVLGIDPGGATCGLVVRRGDELADWQTLERSRSDDRAKWLERATGAAFDLASATPIDLVAIEDLNDPTPQMGVTSVRGLIDTAAVLGAFVEWATSDGDDLAVLVPPGRHGRAAEGLGRAGLLACYPRLLVGDRETSGTGRLRHCRAAWDVAAAGARHRQQEAA